MSTLEVRDLTVEFGQRGGTSLRAVDGLSMTLREGQTMALVGESGSGKSTVVRALSWLLRPVAGQILINDERVGRPGSALRAYRRRVQPIFQDPYASLNPMHDIRHHLARPIQLSRSRLDGAELDRAVGDLLRSVNLTPPEEIARKHPHELSGGQRQRVAIARALGTGPDVLLADEPVSMLDVSIRLEILNLLDALKRERNLAMLYVTHDLATARHFSTEIMVMYRGEIVERGPSDEVILSPAHPYTQLLAAAAPNPTAPRTEQAAARRARQAARAAQTAERRETPLDQGCRFRARCPHAMEVCRTRPPDLQVAAGHLARCWLYGASRPDATSAAGTEVR
jgi:peptide/nickel transport system ATP-binding protein